MTIEDAKAKWQKQIAPSTPIDRLRDAAIADRNATKRRMTVTFVFLLLCVIGAFLNLYGQAVVNGDGWLVSLLRFSIVLVAIPFQVSAWRTAKKRLRERADTALNHREWLERSVVDLRSEIFGMSRWLLPTFFLALLAMMVLVKWIDYRTRADSALECVGLVLVFGAFMFCVAVGAWHHRRQHLAPRLAHFETLLADMRTDDGTTAPLDARRRSSGRS